MNKKVVVVEDDESISDILQIMLGREGFTSIHLKDGNEILNNTIEIPDLFMIDRQLPGADGLEICKYLKQQKSTSGIPVIVLSATPGIGNLAKNAGADAFIEKPFSRKHLMQTIENVMDNNKP